MDPPMGEWSDVRYATEEIQQLCDKVKIQVEKETKTTYQEYKAVFYKVKNILVHHYIIKVYVGENYLHLHVSRSHSTRELIIKLDGVQEHHKWNDLLEPFNSNN